MAENLSEIYDRSAASEAKPLSWLTAVLTYRRQRFSPVLFGGLAVFLFLFAKGNFAFGFTDIFLFVLLVVMLFLFRLFDDLQNLEFDLHKPNRSYTQAQHYERLRSFFISFSVVLFAAFFTVSALAGILLLCFCAINLLLYKYLLPVWKFRNILPLMKYPFLCQLLLYFFGRHTIPPIPEIALSLTLFPAFIIYESLTDTSFRMNKVALAAVFMAVSLPFFPAFSFSVSGLIVAGLLAVSLGALLFSRFRTLPYLLLLALLLTRLILNL